MPSISRNIWWFEIDFLYSGSLLFFSKSVPMTRNFRKLWKDTITLFSIFIIYNLCLILVDIFSYFQGFARSVSPFVQLWPKSNRLIFFKKIWPFTLGFMPYESYHVHVNRINREHLFWSKRSLVFETNRADTIEPYCQGLKIYSFKNDSSSRLCMDHYQKKDLIREQKICWI